MSSCPLTERQDTLKVNTQFLKNSTYVPFNFSGLNGASTGNVHLAGGPIFELNIADDGMRDTA